jgi:hypothetical protein
MCIFYSASLVKKLIIDMKHVQNFAMFKNNVEIDMNNNLTVARLVSVAVCNLIECCLRTSANSDMIQ